MHPFPPLWTLCLGTLAPLSLAAVVFARRPHAGLGVVPLPTVLALAAATWLTLAEAPGPVFGAAAMGLGVFSVLLALTSGIRWIHFASLLGLSVLLATGAARVDDLGAVWVAGPTLLVYGLLASIPVLAAPRGRPASALVAALAPLFLFWPLYQAWQTGLGDAVLGLLPVLLGAVALLGAVVIVRVHRPGVNSGALAAFVAVALLGISAALPVQLRGQWLTVAWAVEIVALTALTRRLGHPLLRPGALILVAAVSVRLLANPYALAYGHTGGWPILNWTLYTWGVPALCLLVASFVWPVRARWERGVPSTLQVLAILVAFALLNVQVSDLFQTSGPVELGGRGVLQGMVRSLSWAGFGVLILVTGLLTSSRPVRLVGFAIVLLATAKVFVVDLWALSGLIRLGSVFGLGVSLLVAAFLFERLVLRQPAET